VTLDPRLLFSALRAAGIRSFAGVPCSILTDLVLAAEASDDVDYVAASVEGEAVSVAAGSWLAGGLGAALMQNSGLGNAVNPLASLCLPYEIPALLIVSWRGEPGRKDAVHHAPMGAATPGLLELFGVPVTVLREDSDVEQCVADAARYMQKERKPAALITPRGLFAKSQGNASRPPPVLAGRTPTSGAAAQRFEGGALPSRSELLDAWLARFPEAPAVSTTGYMSREVSAHGSFDRHFPMQGSMGFASAIALGVARTRPESAVHVLDGDGALIMRMGSLATIGACAPAQLVHVVVDNGTYASTGGQLTVSPGVDFARAALACGYAAAASCRGGDALDDALAFVADAAGSGPVLLHVAVDEREAEGLERPKLSPQEIAAAFRAGRGGVPA